MLQQQLVHSFFFILHFWTRVLGTLNLEAFHNILPKAYFVCVCVYVSLYILILISLLKLSTSFLVRTFWLSIFIVPSVRAR